MACLVQFRQVVAVSPTALADLNQLYLTECKQLI